MFSVKNLLYKRSLIIKYFLATRDNKKTKGFVVINIYEIKRNKVNFIYNLSIVVGLSKWVESEVFDCLVQLWYIPTKALKYSKEKFNIWEWYYIYGNPYCNIKTI